MRDKIWLVTGANAGVGLGTAYGLAKRGATVVMVCRSRERGEVAQAQIKRESGNSISGIVEGVPAPTPPDIFFILVGVAIIIIASAAFVGVVMMGSAVILAIALGYVNIGFEHDTDGEGSHLKVDFQK
jgi:NAD(P)-dependent dehydrogenase (short-subunit alcohol dehydrogenase family)